MLKICHAWNYFALLSLARRNKVSPKRECRLSLYLECHSPLRKYEDVTTVGYTVKYLMYAARMWHSSAFHYRQCMSSLDGRRNDLLDSPIQAHIWYGIGAWINVHWQSDDVGLFYVRVTIIMVVDIRDSKRGGQGYWIQFTPSPADRLDKTLKTAVSTRFINEMEIMGDGGETRVY